MITTGLIIIATCQSILIWLYADKIHALADKVSLLENKVARHDTEIGLAYRVANTPDFNP